MPQLVQRVYGLHLKQLPITTGGVVVGGVIGYRTVVYRTWSNVLAAVCGTTIFLLSRFSLPASSANCAPGNEMRGNEIRGDKQCNRFPVT